jgi:hypothetical protein
VIDDPDVAGGAAAPRSTALGLASLARGVDVREHHVPVSLGDLGAVDAREWDLTIPRIVAYIDGVRTVRGIADASGVDVALVREAVRHLAHYDCVGLVDAFQFSNVYAVTARVCDVQGDPGLSRQLVDAASVPGRPRPPFAQVYACLCSLQRGTTVHEVCLRNDTRRFNIDIRRLVALGVLSGLLLRVHVYFFRVDDAELRRCSPDHHHPQHHHSQHLQHIQGNFPHGAHGRQQKQQHQNQQNQQQQQQQNQQNQQQQQQHFQAGGSTEAPTAPFGSAAACLEAQRIVARERLRAAPDPEAATAAAQATVTASRSWLSQHQLNTLGAMLDGAHPLDEMCSRFGVPSDTMRDIIYANFATIEIWR